MINPIEIAVEPLRTIAIEQARADAEAFVASVREKLASHAWDLEAAYPHPETRKTNRAQYLIATAIRQDVRQMVIRVGKPSYMPNAPYIVAMDAEGVARFIQMRCDDMEASYEAYVRKLTGKIGACDTATLNEDRGTNLWGDSILTITKGNTVERWKTQMIANRSSLGKWFNQWPTRKLKR